mmetsp:Transcript_29293/g.62264  ORF Transcript_29293/g.62264 Transcript_29293/m.62264 type:complete len:286 (-) Transcript_29293:77-934(-)
MLRYVARGCRHKTLRMLAPWPHVELAGRKRWSGGGPAPAAGVAVVTGGSGGIGSGISRRLAAEGMRVVIGYRSGEAKARALLEELPGDHHLALPIDTIREESLTAAADILAERFGGIDLLVNNAGWTTGVPHDDLDALTDEWIDKVMVTNFRGTFACTRAFRRLLDTGEGGTVVNISSVAAVLGLGSNVAYCASKAAVDSMTRSLGRALAPRIRVLSVSPGWVPGEYAKKTVSPDFLQAQIDAAPLARLSTPEDVGDAVWAAHRYLTMATGAVIPVDGGRPLGPK